MNKRLFLRSVAVFVAIICLLPTFACLNTFAQTTVIRPFGDVPKNSWYEKSALYCFEHGYITGTAQGEFSPKANLTRAMTAQFLYSLDGSNKKYTSANFLDVPKSKWYFTCVEWAYENGITKGVGMQRFNPVAAVTRQDFVVMLHKYYIAFGHELDENVSGRYYTEFNDCDKLSEYARNAFSWAVEYGIISGYADNTLRPKAYITRAEAVAIICNYDKAFGHQWQAQVVSKRTCTVNGNTLFTCTDCKAQRRVYTKAYHIWDNGKVSVRPTCIYNGANKFTCLACAGTYSVTIPALGHTWKVVQVIRPTRLEGGYTKYRCTRCSSVKNGDIKPALGRTEGWDSNYDGMLTIDEYLGAYDIVDFLYNNAYDYLGTPYESFMNYLNTPWDMLHNIGQYPHDPQMNCTGFVASVFQRCGGNLGRISSSLSGYYANASNWKRTIDGVGIYHYTFYSVSSMLNSGLLKKGDVIIFVPDTKDENSDYHFGIFWGDTYWDDKFWHSTLPSYYNRSAGVRRGGNQISGIASGTTYGYIYVLPLQRN